MNGYSLEQKDGLGIEHPFSFSHQSFSKEVKSNKEAVYTNPYCAWTWYHYYILF